MDKKPQYHILLEDRDWDVSIPRDDQSIPEIISRQGDKLILKVGHAHYHARLVSQDHRNKKYEISINGRYFNLQLQTPLDRMIADMGLNRSRKKDTNSLAAPMPGMVLSVQVENGQAVKEGQALLILEAMKMENVLKCPIDGVIKQVLTSQGEAVDKGQALIEFE